MYNAKVKIKIKEKEGLKGKEIELLLNLFVLK